MKRLFLALAMVAMVAGCASDPRIDQIMRHQAHQDKQIDYIVMDGISKEEAGLLISSDRSLEEIEKITDQIQDQVNHPTKWWWKNKFKEWSE